MSEADRHNLRGERISVDTIPLVGEANIAGAVRAVADLPRARLLVLAGSIMGGDISAAADELRAVGIPIIALNMVGSITDHVDLVVSDPVQAGTMAVMAVADTADLRPRPPARPAVLSRGGRAAGGPMRIATWNVNSLKARLEKVEWWLERAAPDVLLMQETKLADDDAPVIAVPRWPATSSSTTARGAGTAWRSRAGCGIDGRRHQLRRRARSATPRPGGDARRARRTSTRSTRRGW